MSKTKTSVCSVAFSAGIAVLGMSEQVQALQRGTPNYPVGVDSLYAADYPPVPGLFMFAYGLHYSIDRIRDGRGRKVFNGFEGNVTAIAIRPVVVWDTTIFGARPVTFVVLPFLNRDFKADTVNTYAPPPAPATVPFSAANAGKDSQSNFGLADMTISQNLNWKFDGGWSLNLGIDAWAPTGDYKKNRLFNIGAANSWTFYPSAAVTWRSPDNHHVSFKAQYGFSTKNTQKSADLLGANTLANF